MKRHCANTASHRDRSSAHGPSSPTASSSVVTAGASTRASTCALPSKPSSPSKWTERARAELRASGENARPRRANGETHLTPQEFQIARFVSRGLSNREVAAQLFLSPRTVDFHLRNVFMKLGIASRTELATLRLDAHAPARPASPAEAPSR